MSDLLTLAEFCERIKKSKRSVRRWLSDPETREELGAFKVRGRGVAGEWRIPESALGIVTKVRKDKDARSNAKRFEGTPLCQGVKANGEPCEAPAMRGSHFCHWHQDQENADA